MRLPIFLWFIPHHIQSALFSWTQAHELGHHTNHCTLPAGFYWWLVELSLFPIVKEQTSYTCYLVLPAIPLIGSVRNIPHKSAKYWHTIFVRCRADSETRTRVNTMAKCSSTAELYPHSGQYLRPCGEPRGLLTLRATNQTRTGILSLEGYNSTIEL